MRLLLFALTTGYQTHAFRDAAERLGVELTLGTDRCHVLDDPWRDGAVALRFEDPEQSAGAVAQSAAENPISGIVAIGDRPLLTAAIAAEQLGLAFHSPAGVESASNKHATREVWRKAGLPTPAFGIISRRQNRAAPPPGCEYPCVLKPLGLSGSQGVIRADNLEQFQGAFQRITHLLEQPETAMRSGGAGEWIHVEAFIPGGEFALEGLMHHGTLKTLALFDKPDPLDGPFFEETIYTTPSRLSPERQTAIRRTVESAALALGLRHGPIHAEMRVNDKGIWMIEAAPRPIGGLCARALRFRGGVTLEELHIRHALGMPIEQIERENDAAGVMMIPVPAAGILERVEGTAEAAQVPGIEEVLITAKAGQWLVPWPEGHSYPGFIFARSTSPEFVEHALREAHRQLRFQLVSTLPVL